LTQIELLIPKSSRCQTEILQENVPKGNHKTVCYRWKLVLFKRHKVNILTPKVRQYRSEYSLTKLRSPG